MRIHHLPNTPASARKLLPLLSNFLSEDDKEYLSSLAHQWKDDSPISRAAETVGDWHGRACLIGDERIRLAALMANTKHPLLIITSHHRLAEWVKDLANFFPDDDCSLLGDDTRMGDKIYIATVKTAITTDVWETFSPRSVIVDTYADPSSRPNDVVARLKDYADEIRSFTALVYDETLMENPKFPLMTSLTSRGSILNKVRTILYGDHYPAKVVASTVKGHLTCMGFDTALSHHDDERVFISAGGALKRHTSPLTACSIIPTNVTVDIPTPSVTASYGVWEAFWTAAMDNVSLTCSSSPISTNHFLHTSHEGIAVVNRDGRMPVGDVRKLPAYSLSSMTAISLIHPPTSVKEMEDLLTISSRYGIVIVDETPECRSMCALWSALRKASSIEF